MKITSNIFTIAGGSDSDSSDAMAYLVKSGHEAAVIDAGTGKATEKIIENIRNTGTDPLSVKYLFLTHCHFDHTGGANELREKTGCKIIIHDLDADYIELGDSDVTAASWYREVMKPTKVDIRVSGPKESFRVGSLDLHFYHTPGHSPGSSVLTVGSDGLLVLFGQDVHGPLNDMLLSSRRDYTESLEFLLSLEADILCEGHFGVYRGREEVHNFIESYL